MFQYDVALLPRTGEDFYTAAAKKPSDETEFFNGEVPRMHHR